jgi:hypothetical protein
VVLLGTEGDWLGDKGAAVGLGTFHAECGLAAKGGERGGVGAKNAGVGDDEGVLGTVPTRVFLHPASKSRTNTEMVETARARSKRNTDEPSPEHLGRYRRPGSEIEKSTRVFQGAAFKKGTSDHPAEA